MLCSRPTGQMPAGEQLTSIAAAVQNGDPFSGVDDLPRSTTPDAETRRRVGEDLAGIGRWAYFQVYTQKRRRVRFPQRLRFGQLRKPTEVLASRKFFSAPVATTFNMPERCWHYADKYLSAPCVCGDQAKHRGPAPFDLRLYRSSHCSHCLQCVAMRLRANR